MYEPYATRKSTVQRSRSSSSSSEFSTIYRERPEKAPSAKVPPASDAVNLLLPAEAPYPTVQTNRGRNAIQCMRKGTHGCNEWRPISWFRTLEVLKKPSLTRCCLFCRGATSRRIDTPTQAAAIMNKIRELVGVRVSVTTSGMEAAEDELTEEDIAQIQDDLSRRFPETFGLISSAADGIKPAASSFNRAQPTPGKGANVSSGRSEKRVTQDFQPGKTRDRPRHTIHELPNHAGAKSPALVTDQISKPLEHRHRLPSVQREQAATKIAESDGVTALDAFGSLATAYQKAAKYPELVQQFQATCGPDLKDLEWRVFRMLRLLKMLVRRADGPYQEIPEPIQELWDDLVALVTVLEEIKDKDLLEQFNAFANIRQQMGKARDLQQLLEDSSFLHNPYA